MWRLVTRNWWVSPGRTLAMVLSVAVGVAIVVIITSSYETARTMIRAEVFGRWLGAAHLSIQPAGAHWGGLDAELADAVGRLPTVAHVAVRLQRRMAILSSAGSDQLLGATGWHVDAVGIEPDKEAPFHRITGLEGRMMAVGERGVAVMEANMLRDWELSLGDEINLTTHRGGPQKTLRIVGSFESPRLGDFQRPLLYAALADIQELNNEPGRASAVDIMITDTTSAALHAAQSNIEKLLADRGESRKCRVESTAAAQTLLDEADRITRLVLTVVTCIVMLTSFFIILSTMSISLFARRAQLGTMRCVGMTRVQLARMVLMEVVPPTAAGVFLGVAAALSLLYAVPRWLGHIDLVIRPSLWGLTLAVGGAILTALISWVFLCFELNRVTPLLATMPYARPARRWIAVLSGLFGVGLLLVHESLVRTSNPDQWLGPLYVTLGGCTLYGGYIALAPLLVVGLGPLIARILGRIARLHPTLTAESFTRTPWRATAACWVMTVGLALIVYHIVAMEAVRAIWNFPGRLPEAFVWSPKPVPGDVVQQVRRLPTIKRVTSVADMDCSLETHAATTEKPESKSIVDLMLAKLTRPVFIASEPDGLLSMMKVDFVEGDAEEARRKLTAGGHILIPTQTAKQLGIHLGDRITVHIRDRSSDFIVAGVIQSPALDLAVTSFQANSYMQFAAASALLGTNADLRDRFGLDLASMIMVDLQLPDIPAPPNFHTDQPPDHRSDRSIAHYVTDLAQFIPEEGELLESFVPNLKAWLDEPPDTPLPAELANELRRFGRAFQAVHWTWSRMTPDENWQRFRERLVLYGIANLMERPDAILGSLHRLKREVDRAIARGTLVLTWLPSILLAVAMIGVANLMMVSVQTRSRQFAMLRAIGAVRSQVLRLVLIEAATIGMVGSVIGVLLGLHQAATDNRATAALIGFHAEYIIRMGPLAAAIGLTIGACLLAGLGPARYAARGNVTSALQAT